MACYSLCTFIVVTFFSERKYDYDDFTTDDKAISRFYPEATRGISTGDDTPL